MERRAHVGSRSPVVKWIIHALHVRYSHAGSRWWSLAIGSRIMWCAFFTRQSRYSNTTHALTNARLSFWIMRVHQSPAFSIIFDIFPCVTRSFTAIVKTTCDRPFKHQQNYYHMKWFLWHSRQYLGFVQNIWHYNQIIFSEWFVLRVDTCFR